MHFNQFSIGYGCHFLFQLDAYRWSALLVTLLYEFKINWFYKNTKHFPMLGYEFLFACRPLLFLIIWCFRSSRCVLVLVQWNRRWSIVWSPWPQIHFASSRRLKRWRYALVFPCPDSTAASFGVKLIFIPSLSRIVRKYCFVVAALWLVVHSACHFCLASSSASWYRVLLGILLNQ